MKDLLKIIRSHPTKQTFKKLPQIYLSSQYKEAAGGKLPDTQRPHYKVGTYICHNNFGYKCNFF